MKKELGIYIHIPFCKKKCYYCDFVSYPDKLILEERYIEAVIRELESYDLSKYNITTIDKPSIEDIMLFYVKGEK